MKSVRPHPFQVVIENAWDLGQTPQLIVFLKQIEKALPRGVAARFKGAKFIPFDLRPSYPLNPYFDEAVCCADLAFAGDTVRLHIPWGAIWGVTVVETGEEWVRLQRTMPLPEPLPAAEVDRGVEAKPGVVVQGPWGKKS